MIFSKLPSCVFAFLQERVWRPLQTLTSSDAPLLAGTDVNQHCHGHVLRTDGVVVASLSYGVLVEWRCGAPPWCPLKSSASSKPDACAHALFASWQRVFWPAPRGFVLAEPVSKEHRASDPLFLAGALRTKENAKSKLLARNQVGRSQWAWTSRLTCFAPPAAMVAWTLPSASNT